MEAPEAVISIVKGTKNGLILSADPSDPLRILVLSEISKHGIKVEHHASFAMVAPFLESEPLEFTPERTLLLVPWPDTPEGFKHAARVMPLLPGGPYSVGFLSEKYPPSKTKESSALLSQVVTVGPPSDVGTIPWLEREVGARGFKITTSACRMLLNRLGSSYEALPNILDALTLYCGEDKGITETVVLESVAFIPEEDGKKTLDDLLHLKGVSLARRLQWLPTAQLVPLFRAAASEMIIIHQVSLSLEEGKGKLDTFKVADSLGIREDILRTRYLSLAKELGKDRVTKALARLEQADAVMLRTPFDSREAAMALAMQICQL